MDTRVVLNPLQGSTSVPLGPQLLQALKADVNVICPRPSAEVNRRLEQSFSAQKSANGCNLVASCVSRALPRGQADATETKVRRFAGGELVLNRRIF